MDLTLTVKESFYQLEQCLKGLSNQDYTMAIPVLSESSIGSHIRHILELYIELEKGYWSGVIQYEARKRDKVLETNCQLALLQIDHIVSNLNKQDKDLTLLATYGQETENPLTIKTNYYRELAYNLEHMVHHMALIRIGLSQISNVILPASFGVAASTILYRKSCVQ